MMNRVRHGDKLEMANDLRKVFKTGDETYTVEKAWYNWNLFLNKWSKDYRSIQNMKGNFLYKSYSDFLFAVAPQAYDMEGKLLGDKAVSVCNRHREMQQKW